MEQKLIQYSPPSKAGVLGSFSDQNLHTPVGQVSGFPSQQPKRKT